MKQLIVALLFAAAAFLIGGCSYINDGSWEISNCGYCVSSPAPGPAPTAVRSWNYPWEWQTGRNPLSCRY